MATNMNRWGWQRWGLGLTLLWVQIMTVSGIAEPLTPDDYDRLSTRKTTQHIVYETYMKTDKGLASVFGYQFDTYLTDRQCFILAISGAVNGERGGYGFAAFGWGYTLPIHQKWAVNMRGFIGSGGGGGLPAGGGFMLEGLLGLVYYVSSGMGVEVNVGQLTYPTGTFSSGVINVGVQFTDYEVYLPWSGG